MYPASALRFEYYVNVNSYDLHIITAQQQQQQKYPRHIFYHMKIFHEHFPDITRSQSPYTLRHQIAHKHSLSRSRNKNKDSPSRPRQPGILRGNGPNKWPASVVAPKTTFPFRKFAPSSFGAKKTCRFVIPRAIGPLPSPWANQRRRFNAGRRSMLLV